MGIMFGMRWLARPKQKVTMRYFSHSLAAANMCAAARSYSSVQTQEFEVVIAMGSNLVGACMSFLYYH